MTRSLRRWRAVLIALASGSVLSGCYYDPYTGSYYYPYAGYYGYPWPAPPQQAPPPPAAGGVPPAGAPVPLQNPETGTPPSASMPIERGPLPPAANCQDRPMIVTVEGEQVQALVRMCRQPDGSWRIQPS